jgi:hypothetical protein
MQLLLVIMSDSGFPIVIGGIGGSGTRILAEILQIKNFYIGGSLNPPKDNLWAVFLFNRRSILYECLGDSEELMRIFYDKMSGSTHFINAIWAGYSQGRLKVCPHSPWRDLPALGLVGGSHRFQCPKLIPLQLIRPPRMT